MTTMRFPISLAVFSLAISAVIGAAALVQPTTNQAQGESSNATIVAYRGSGRFQW